MIEDRIAFGFYEEQEIRCRTCGISIEDTEIYKGENEMDKEEIDIETIKSIPNVTWYCSLECGD